MAGQARRGDPSSHTLLSSAMAASSAPELTRWPTYQEVRDQPPLQTVRYEGPFWSGLYMTGPASADWCGFHIQVWNKTIYTRWRGAWWKLEGPNPLRRARYDPLVHRWIKEE